MPRLDPQKRRTQNVFTVTMRDGTTVTGRRRSLQDLTALGALPIQLASAFDDVVARYRNVPEDDIDGAMASSGDEDGKNTIAEVRRRVVCAVVTDPVVTLDDDGDPTHLQIDELDLNEQNAIYITAITPPPLDSEPAVPELPDLSTEVARRDFRGAESDAAPDAVSDGKDVPLPAQRVADARVEGQVAGKRRAVSARRGSGRVAHR